MCTRFSTFPVAMSTMDMSCGRPVGGVEPLPVGAQADAPGAVAYAVDRAHLLARGDVDHGHRPAPAARDVERLAVGREHGSHRARAATAWGSSGRS